MVSSDVMFGKRRFTVRPATEAEAREVLGSISVKTEAPVSVDFNLDRILSPDQNMAHPIEADEIKRMIIESGAMSRASAISLVTALV